MPIKIYDNVLFLPREANIISCLLNLNMKRHLSVCPVVRSKYYFIREQEIIRNWPYFFSFSRVIQSNDIF